jgi:uncharacterized protein involved in outer membrane biogenesis
MVGAGAQARLTSRHPFRSYEAAALDLARLLLAKPSAIIRRTLSAERTAVRAVFTCGTPMKVSKLTRRVLIALAVVVGLPMLLLVAAVLVIESEWAERRIEQFVSARLERAVTLDEIDLQLAWPPRIHLQMLQIANPGWAKTQRLLDAENLLAAVEILPLFRGEVVVDRLSAARVFAGLEQDGKRATWRFGPKDDEPSRFHLQEVEVENGRIYYGNENEKTALHIRASGELGRSHGELEMTASGAFRGEEAKASAKAPSLMLSGERPIPLTFQATVGKTSGAGNGTFQASTDGVNSIDAHVELRGQTLAHLHDLFGINVPQTPPYSLEGGLRHTAGVWSFDPFKGHVGDSDLHGSWSYDTRGKKPMLRAALTATLLDLDDLAPIIGAPPATGPGETASPKQKREARKSTAESRVLPDKPFSLERWDDMNADVRLSARRVEHRPELPIDMLLVHLTLEAGVLRLQPLSFGVAGGTVHSTIQLDSTGKSLRADLQLKVRDLALSRLFPTLQSMKASAGKLYGNGTLVGHGRTVADLLGSSTGNLGLLVSGGRISALLVEVLGLDLAEALIVLATKDVQTPLRCAVADLAIKDGVVKPDAFVIDTRDTFITLEGTIDLKAERVDLVTHPHPKDPSLFSARSPIVVTGTFKDLDARPKAGPIAARVAAAGLLALVNPLLALVPFIEPGTGEDSNCGQLLMQAKQGASAKAQTN